MRAGSSEAQSIQLTRRGLLLAHFRACAVTIDDLGFSANAPVSTTYPHYAQAARKSQSVPSAMASSASSANMRDVEADG